MSRLFGLCLLVMLGSSAWAWTHGSGSGPPPNPCSSNTYKLDFSQACNSLYINTITY